MEFLKNVSVKLHATGLAAAVIVWVMAVAAVATFGRGQLALSVLLLLSGGILLIMYVAGRS
ncbi:MAG: hypothetical protein JO081_05700 [Alphaproteobacteria bacterium]|nr:hypothetical protein [Alphaproteobacteria bacterium]